jgi:hypothetical protein
MQDGRTRKLARGISVALAAAFVAVPAAQARLAGDARDSALYHKEPAVTVDARHAALLNKKAVAQQAVVRTDARHAALLNKAHVNRLIMQERRVPKIAQMHRHLANLNLPAADSSVSTGFDWTDAGLGAGAVFGLVLLASGGVLVTRRRLVGA